MLNRTMLAISLLLGLTTAAHADKKADALARADANLGSYMRFANAKKWGKSDFANVATIDCRGEIKIAKQAGVTDADTIQSPEFKAHPKAKAVGTEYEITIGDAGWVCDQLDAKGKVEKIADEIRKAVTYRKNNPNPPTAETVKGYSAFVGADMMKAGKACVDGIAALVAGGVPESTQVATDEGNLTLAEGRAACEHYIEQGSQWDTLLQAAKQAKRAEIAAKYEPHGVKGDRLELFIEYDGVSFRGKKCVIIDDIKTLVKAKYVYQWLENSDGTHTIRKYTFKGNKYKVSEKTYLTEAKAYKGCK